MAAIAQRTGQIGKPIVVDDDDDSIDEDQLIEYREDVQLLGNFPVSHACFRSICCKSTCHSSCSIAQDKVKINSLTMIAGDYAESKSSAGCVYQIIKERLLSTNRDNMLPLVYLLDSILKNVRGFYIDLVQDDAVNWMPKVYHKLQDAQQAKLKKVWNTWEEFNIFSTEAWKAMGSCFDNQGGSILSSAVSDVAGIARTVRSFFVGFFLFQKSFVFSHF